MTNDRSDVSTARSRQLAFNGLKSFTDASFLGVLLILIVMFVYFSVSSSSFLTSANINSMLTGVSILFVVSIGMTFAMLSGGIDLSVGSILALSCILFGKLANQAGIPIGLVIVLTLVAGAMIGGFLNGGLIGKIGLSFLVVTLGSNILLRGVVNLWSNTKTEQIISPFLEGFAFNKFLAVPYPVWVMIVVLALSLYVLRSTYFGRDVYAVGGNADAARLSGINVGRTIMIVYAITGLLSALGGVITVSRVGAASPLVGETLIFEATAAVLIGGTSFKGGAGGVTGTAVGVLFLGVLQNGLAVSGVQTFWQQVVTGTILILAVLIEKFRSEERISSSLSRFRRTTPDPVSPAS
ncbi:MAG: ABC transporter permease [Actinobacteria bacterium]|nr:ABC transporter permease [Actinomycetota bacterium]